MVTTLYLDFHTASQHVTNDPSWFFCLLNSDLIANPAPIEDAIQIKQIAKTPFFVACT
jgi:hypothetical protein